MPTGSGAVYAHVGMIAVNGARYMPWYAGLPSLPRATCVIATDVYAPS